MKNKFDSNEELYFSWYLEDLLAKRYIVSCEKIEEPIEISKGLYKEYVKPMKKVSDKILTQTILKPSVYTPDFAITWTEKALGIFVQRLSDEDKITCPFICDDSLESIVEIKGGFDRGNMTRLVINNIKFIYDKYEVYINMIKIPDLFKKTFTPNRYFMTDKSFQPRKFNYKPKTIKEYVDYTKR